MGRCFFQGYPFENESKDVINIIIHCRRPAEKFGSSFCHSECNILWGQPTVDNYLSLFSVCPSSWQ